MSHPSRRSQAEQASTLHHRSASYSGPDAFLPAALAAFATAPTAPCLFLADAARIRALRSSAELSASSSFLDMDVQGRNPARVMPALQAFVDAHPGRHLRVVAEPLRADMSDAVRTEAELAELMLGLAQFRAWPITLTCLYDRTNLPADLTDLLETCHSGDIDEHDIRSSVHARLAEALDDPPDDAVRTTVDRVSLRELRTRVATAAGDLGLDGERADDLVYAVNEVVTNSICHGEGRARVTLWRDGASVVCQVADAGVITDPLVGRIAPRPGQTGGRGLWLVHQLCDLVQLRSSAAGTVVRMSVDDVG